MKIIELNKTVGVEALPFGSNRFKLFNDKDRPYLSYFEHVDVKRFYIPKGFTFLSLHSEMTEEIAKTIMPTLSDEGFEFIYKCYTNPNGWFNTALESYQSWIKSLYGEQVVELVILIK